MMAAAGNQRAEYHPMYLDRALVLHEVCVYVNTTNASAFPYMVRLFTDPLNRVVPGELVIPAATIADTTTTGMKTFPIPSLPLTLPAGNYVFVVEEVGGIGPQLRGYRRNAILGILRRNAQPLSRPAVDTWPANAPAPVEGRTLQDLGTTSTPPDCPLYVRTTNA